MTIIDLAKFRQCVYELIENEDSIIEQERRGIKFADALTEGFLHGELAIYYDTKSQSLRWIAVKHLKHKGLR